MSRRRLDRLEGTLSPQEAVLHWLTEAQALGSLPAYVVWLADQPDAASPLVGLPRRVEGAVRSAMRDRPHRTLEDATRRAVSDTYFLVHLVLGVNGSVETVAQCAGLRAAALVWWMRSLTGVGGAHQSQARDERMGWPGWRETAHSHSAELEVLEAARIEAEARYLGGHSSLFPGLAAKWHGLLEHARRLEPVGAALAESGVAPGGSPAPDRARVEARLHGLVVHARVEALDLLGDAEGAMRLSRRELQFQLAGAS